ncbi:MAG: hypothetical protein IKK77_04085 [Clostridia bacterium]|nr:hypothetical protein [Clostridia bacterium]
MTFKKFLSIFLSVILIASLLSACKKTNTPTIENTSSKQEEEQKVTLVDTIEATETHGLYKLGAEIKTEASNADIKIIDNTAYIFFDMGSELQVVSFSVFENKVLGTTTLSGENHNYGVLDSGEFYVTNLQTSQVSLFEKDGNLKEETNICDSPLKFGFLDISGQFFIYQKTDSSVVNRYDFLSTETKEGTVKINITGSVNKDKENVYVKDEMSKHYSINFETFSITKTQTEAFREYIDGVGFSTEGEYVTHTALKNGIAKYMSKFISAQEKVITAEENRFIVVSEEPHNYLRIYDFDSGFATGEIEVTGAILDAQFVDENHVFIAYKDTNTSKNLYHLFAINENEGRNTFEGGRLDDLEIYKNVFGPASNFEDTEAGDLAYEKKIRFFYGKTGEDFKPGFSYSLISKTDFDAKLNMAKKVLEVLDAELLTEATAGREIWVYLCAGLDNKNTEYSELAAHTELYNHKVILIDAKCSDNKFAELLCHEFAHILDDYFPQSIKDGFSSITPENIKSEAYTGDYKNISSDQYTPYDSDKNNVWFYNNYCRINEKEDRTITLGEMFRNYVVASSGDLFNFENVKKKAGYLSKALEETFDYCKETERQLWEIAYSYTE